MKGFAPLSRTLPYWPEDLLGPPPAALDMIGVSELAVASTPTSLAFAGKVAWLQEIEVAVPAIDGATFALLDAGGFTEVGFNVELAPDFSLTFGDLTAEFRFVSDALKPVTFNTQTNTWVPVLDSNTGLAKPAVFAIGNIYLHIDGDGQVEFVDNQGSPASPMITPPALQLGDSGIVLEIHQVQLYLSDKQAPPPGAPAGFKGVTISDVTLHLGDRFGAAAAPDTVSITNLMIGSSGFSGTISADWNYTVNTDGSYSGHGLGELFGLQFGLKSLQFVFSQNRLVGSAIKGIIMLPFFDHPLAVTVGYDANGGFTVAIDAPGGIFTLTKTDFVKVAVESIEIDVNAAKAIVRISGTMTPLFDAGVITWPTFEMRELSIDSDGHVKLDGGWIDLPAQKPLDLHGFTVAITKFGMGRTDGGGRWIGFSGKVNLIKGVQGSASVDGLRITLKEGGGVGISFDGVGVDLKVAGAFELKGAVKFTDDGIDKRFDGAATLALKKPELEFDTRVTIGHRQTGTENFPFFAMYGGLELPAGIPLGPSGAAIFGFSGLLALNMKPGRDPQVPWYALPQEPDWYHKTTLSMPKPGVIGLEKWDPKKNAKAFGAGLTIGTYADNGFTFNARALLVLAFPGPLVLIEGFGNLLKDRKELGSTDEPFFRAIAILDEDAGEYTFGLDAFYQYDKGTGGVIAIRGSLEAYYKKSDPRAWHIWLGKKDPTTSRIQAQIISLFKATSYFMIDAHDLQMGAWIGYDRQWNPTPLSISLQAWLDANAKISFKPNHFHADMWLHAAIALSAFGVGAGLSADAMLAADIMDPFLIKGELSVELKLPWPLKKISKDVALKWARSGPPSPIPIVLQAVAIGHLKSSAVWPLAMNATLVPSYDNGEGYLNSAAPSGALSPPPSGAPIVPMDARPSIAFGRAVHDDALIGVNAQPRQPEYEQIGDPASGTNPAMVRYALKGIVLEKWKPGLVPWTAVAGKGAGASGLPPLYGSWMPVPSGAAPNAVDQTKLMLWSKTGFDQTRLTGRSWNDWFTNAYDNYPCVNARPLNCYDFDSYALGRVTTNVDTTVDQPSIFFFHHDNQGLGFYSISGWTVESLAQPIDGKTHALRPFFMFTPNTYLILSLQGLASPTGIVRVVFDKAGQKTVLAYTLNSAGVVSMQEFDVETANVEVIVDGTIIGLAITAAGRVGIVEVCLGGGGNDDYLQALALNLKSSTSVWTAQGNVLEPYTDYRLVIATEAEVVGDGAGTRPQTSYAYFKTGGPPVLGGFTVPDGQTPASIEAGPDNLAAYVRQTIPATVGQGDAAPAMPRPVYRTYDIGVVFNANYVDMLYKMSYRDLMLQILDSNGAPARDALGRALSFENPWGVTSDLILDNASASWIKAVDPNCMPIPKDDIVHDQTMTTVDTPLFLDPSTRYKARLGPLLLHDNFSPSRYANMATAVGNGARIGDWRVVELDTVQQASQWTVNIASAWGTFMGQSDALVGSANASTDCPPGSALIWDPVSGGPAWKSFRLSNFLSTGSGGAIGLVFLFQDAQNYFQFTMRQSDGACKLVSWINGSPSKLQEETLAFAVFTDMEVVIEVSDNGIRVFVDGSPTLAYDVDLSAHPGGKVGLWCWNNASARFKDIRVEDQSGQAAVAYGFEFVTSDYVNYFHLAHARRTPVWDIETHGTDKERTASELAQLTTMFAQKSDAALDAPETRQYEDLVALWLGPGLVRDPELPEISRILRNGETVAWLVRTPEPWDWKRSQITLRHTYHAVPISDMLGPVKITGAALGMSDANDEFVDLLMLEEISLNGWRVELRDDTASSSNLADAPPFNDPSSIWTTLYTFASQDRIKAGMRIRLYSGGLVQPPDNHTQLMMNIAPQGDPGIVQLPASGADLRLIDSSGRTACAIRILPETAFDLNSILPPLGARMLRKGDATGLIIVPSVDDAFAPGAYALSMVYRRNNSVKDPESVVLSQAGDTMDEQAFVPLY